jgi:N-acetylglutamate synthase-like GNAT family acetyltransferase
MNYRKATAKDGKGIATVLKECYNIDSVEEGKAVFKKETAKDYHFIVADDNGKIAGLVTWQMHGLPKHQLCELDRIAVLGTYRGKGIALKLFDALVKDANMAYKKDGFKLRKLYLLTHAANKRAHSFYSKMGMHHETTLKEHFYKDVDEWVYVRFF